MPFLTAYAMFESGFLWGGGGIRDQPAAYIEALGIVGRAVADIRNEETDKRKGGSPHITPRQARRFK